MREEKKGKPRKVINKRALGTRQGVRGLVLAVHSGFFLIFELRAIWFERTVYNLA